MLSFFFSFSFSNLSENHLIQGFSATFEIIDNFSLSLGLIESNDSAFSNSSNVEISIPSNINDKIIITIGKNAFMNTKFIAVKFPDTIKTIESCAFYKSNIENFDFPGSLEEIKDSACCSFMITSIDLSKTKIKNIPKFFASFAPIKKLLLPKTVIEICDSAFRGTNLTELELPESVQCINEYAFSFSSELKTISIPGVNEIKKFAFECCEALEEIRNSENLQIIRSYAFKQTNLTKLVLGKN